MKTLFLTAMIAVPVLLTGCSTLKRGAEFEFKKEVKEVLTDDFQAYFIQAMKTDDAGTIMRQQSVNVLNDWLPPRDRTTVQLMMSYFGESLAAIALAVVVYLKKRLNDEKKRNGRGQPSGGSPA